MGTKENPFVVQIVLEGEGNLEFLQLEKACRELNASFLKSYQYEVREVESLGNYINQAFQGLLNILFEKKEAKIKVMLRVYHSVMDGRGALKFLEVLLQKSSDDNTDSKLNFENEQDFLSTCRDVPKRTYPQLQKKRYLKKYKFSNRKSYYENTSLDSINEGTSSILSVALCRVFKQDLNIMHPVDIRRHISGENLCGNLSLPIFQTISQGKSWQEAEAGLLTAILNNDELKSDPLGALVKITPKPLMRFALSLTGKIMSLTKKFPVDAVISYLGKVDPLRYRTKEFELKNIVSIAPQIPFTPLSIVAVDFEGKLNISLSSQSKMFLLEHKEAIISEVKNQNMVKLVSKKVDFNYEQKIHSLISNFPQSIEVNKDFYCENEFHTLIDQYMCLIEKSEIGQRSVIAVDVERGLDFVAIIYAIWRSGNTFLPLDQTLSEEKKKEILENSNTKLRIKSTSLEDELDTSMQPEVKPPSKNDIAYIIYTSGTTGGSKGVRISFENLVNYLEWSKKTYQLSEKFIFQFFTATSVDLSITSYILPCYIKAKLKIYPNQFESSLIKREFLFSDNSVIKLTPTHLRFLLQSGVDFRSVARLIVGGENFTAKLGNQVLKEVSSNCLVINEYGPTELTVGCASYLFNNSHQKFVKDVPVGELCDNTKAILLTPHGSLCKEGEQGELLVAGNNLASGYTRNEDRLNTFLFEDDVYYRTGDICFRTEKNLYYVGRVDDQVKINGYRVELREVSKAIERILSGSHVETRCFSNGETNYLVSYVSQFPKDLPVNLTNKLLSLLPKSHIPSKIVRLEKVHLDKSGKTYTPGAEGPYVGNIELNLDSDWNNYVYTLWGRIFNKQVSELNGESHFYDLGGNSLMLIELFSQLESWYKANGKKDKALELVVSKFLKEPTLFNMLNFI